MSIAFFDLPPELRTCIYELYWLSLTRPTPGMSRLDQRRRARYNNDVLKPKLICQHFRDEYEDAWAGVATVELPCQTMKWSHVPTVENNKLDRHESIHHLFTFVRDWLDEAPSYLRERLRHLRVTYSSARPFANWTFEMEDALQHIRGDDIAILMERLDNVHSQLCIEVRIFTPKYWHSSQNRYAVQTIEFALKQQTPEKVPKKGGAEWICINSTLTVC